MRSIGSAAYLPDKTLIETFSANLEPLSDASTHPDTMAWWKNHLKAWEAAQRDQQPPAQAMSAYADWLKALPGIPVFVSYPAGFDFTFVYWYLIRFTGHSPFSFSALDIKTMAMMMLGKDYRRSTKRSMPSRWFDALPHTHQALDEPSNRGFVL